MSLHGALHIVSGAVGFIALIAACLVLARRFAASKRRGLSAYFVLTGVFFLASFFGIAAGSGQSGAMLTIVNLAFTAGVILAWAWVSVISLRLMSETSEL